MPYRPQHTTTLNLARHALVAFSVTASFALALALAGITGVFSSSADAVPATYTIWPTGTTPRTGAAADTAPVQLGVKFSPSSNGKVTALRFFKAPENTGQHVGMLWGPDGTLLASVPFAKETAAGWQEAPLSKPVPLSAGKTYTASYSAPRGRYSADLQALSPTNTQRTGALTATQGVYTYGTGRPAQVSGDSNYFVDVRFAQLKSSRTYVGTPSPTSATSSTATSTPSSSTSATSTSSSTTTSSSSSTTAPTGTPTAATSTPSTTAATGCAARPSSCGYPDASNTGVVAGTTLRSVPSQVSSGPGWHWDSRGWVSIDGDGAVFEGYAVNANIDVVADNVRIRNIRMVQGGEGFGISLRHTAGVSIENSEITAPDSSANRLMVGIKDIYGDSTGLRVIGNDISRTSTGVQVESGLIQDNYIHDLGLKGSDHVNGTTSNGGSRQLTLRHNTVFNPHSQTDAISLFQDFGSQANRIIDNNLLAGGGYTIYAGANPGKESTATNIQVTNNRISRMYYPRGGSYGPITAYTSGGGNTSSGNIWDDTGAPLG